MLFDTSHAVDKLCHVYLSLNEVALKTLLLLSHVHLSGKFCCKQSYSASSGTATHLSTLLACKTQQQKPPLPLGISKPLV